MVFVLQDAKEYVINTPGDVDGLPILFKFVPEFFASQTPSHKFHEQAAESPYVESS